MSEYLEGHQSLNVDDVNRIWKKYDRDHSGHLDECECSAFLVDLLRSVSYIGKDESPVCGDSYWYVYVICIIMQAPHMLDKARARLSEAMDTDGNGRIDKDE